MKPPPTTMALFALLSSQKTADAVRIGNGPERHILEESMLVWAV
jgi:hypothetical protein